MTHSPPPELDRSLEGRYAIEREIGRGGMATVYLARDLRHSRSVAIKVLHPDLSAVLGAERFLREIAIGAQLQHPHILTLIDSGESNGLLYYVMPFVEGESLRDRLTRAGGPLPLNEATRILRDVVDALAHAHRHGVVHRDIKPENIMLAERHAMVVDFGVAKALTAGRYGTSPGTDDESTLTRVGTSMGTPAYMAPEQAAGDPAVDHRADIYAVGVVAYEMITGRPPFRGTAQEILFGHVSATPAPLPAHVPAALSRLIAKCLEKKPEARHQSAEALLEEVEQIGGAHVDRRTILRRAVPIGAVAVLGLAAAVYAMTAESRRERWVRDMARPELRRLIEAFEFDSAFALHATAASILPDDSILTALGSQASAGRIVQSEPVGATVKWARFSDTTHWVTAGATPTDTVRFPRGTFVRMRLEKPGFRTGEFLFSPALGGRVFRLDPVSSPDSAMVHVSAGNVTASLPGLDQLPRVELGDFLMDRREITNRQYREFVRAGGYSKPEFWTEVMIVNGRRLSFQEATALFRDRTGRPGPATWEGGDAPAGQDDVPVGGVSWFEAAAYAKFAGKSLPSVYHWIRAAEPSASPLMVPGSVFEASGPAKVNIPRGMSPFGVFDMAGNVREWCQNPDAEGQRFILGGGWSDLSYSFNDAYAQQPLDRSAINGIRLVKYLRDEPNRSRAEALLPRAHRDYAKEQPASPEVYETLRRMYDYDYTSPAGKVESRDTTPANWTLEKVTYDAGYGNERVPALLFLPKHARPPYQIVVVFPGDGGFNGGSSAGLANGTQVDWYVKSGRAVLQPIYKGTYERDDSMPNSIPNPSTMYRDHVLMWSKDMRRGIDYLATRPDMDTTRMAYQGLSWGGRMGGLMPAIEPRFKAVILVVAGLRMQRPRPEADPFNFIPHITLPVLMLNGRHDFYFPTETAQKPFFRMLGTPADRKRYVVYEGGHSVPRADLIRESLDWLDKYLGPVAR